MNAVPSLGLNLVPRYHFNGQESDNELTEGSLDFGARIYESRLGRWMSVDPLGFKFSAYSPYNFAINSPILFIDPDGEVIKVVDPTGKHKPYIYKPGDPVPEGASPFVKEVYESLNNVYTKGGPVAVGIIDGVVNDPNYTVEIIETTEYGSGETGFDEEFQTIAYNPYEGMVVCDNGVEGKQSPDLGLLHELDHADQHRKLSNNLKEAKKSGTRAEVKAARKALKTYTKDKDLAEENRATKNEGIVAKAMGLGVRGTYDSVKSIYKTVKSTTTEESKDVSDEEKKQIEKENKGRESMTCSDESGNSGGSQPAPSEEPNGGGE